MSAFGLFPSPLLGADVLYHGPNGWKWANERDRERKDHWLNERKISDQITFSKVIWSGDPNREKWVLVMSACIPLFMRRKWDSLFDNTASWSYGVITVYSDFIKREDFSVSPPCSLTWYLCHQWYWSDTNMIVTFSDNNSQHAMLQGVNITYWKARSFLYTWANL